MWEDERASVLHGSVGIGKSALARAFMLWVIGNDPGVQILWLSATQRQPKTSLKIIANLINAKGTRSRIHHVFPNLRPGEKWTSTEIEVDREVDPLQVFPTISVYGAFSDSVLGSRADFLVIDDLCNFTNTLTQDSREKMTEWLGSVFSRLTNDDVRIMVLGNMWHEQDATMRMARKSRYAYMRTPAYTEDKDGGRTPTAPAALSLERIAELEEDLGPVQAERMLKCRIAKTELGRFRSEWFGRALEAGYGKGFRPQHAVLGSVYTGVDLGHTQKTGSDYTAMVTVMVLPNKHKIIIDVRAGRWSSQEIIANIVALRTQYGSIIGIESNGGQRLFIDAASDITAIPLVEKNTGVDKYTKTTGIESLGLELAQGYWIFPCPKPARRDDGDGLVEDVDEDDLNTAGWTLRGVGQPHPELQALINEALVYDPTKHTGDRLMAWWICAETIRKSALMAFADIQDPMEVPALDIFSR